MKIMVFGGAFDPPHLGHFQVIQDVLQQDLVDEIWLVPTGKHDFDKQMTADKHRISMLKILIRNLPEQMKDKLKINRFELSAQEVNQTIDTLDTFAQQFPQHEFYWLMGSDNLARFDEWDQYQRIIKDYQTHIYPRAGFKNKPWYEGLVLLKNVEPVKISSTEIKAKLKQGESISSLVLPEIEKYIQRQHLYQ